MAVHCRIVALIDGSNLEDSNDESAFLLINHEGRIAHDGQVRVHCKLRFDAGEYTYYSNAATNQGGFAFGSALKPQQVLWQ
jgi:hypothetical protein